jgi:hypothetical protein
MLIKSLIVAVSLGGCFISVEVPLAASDISMVGVT